MAVSEYKPINTYGCRYTYDKLEKVVYLVPKSHTKNVYIDDGAAYIDGLSGSVTRLEGFNIQFNEESSLDERYKFSKTVTFSLHGYEQFQMLYQGYNNPFPTSSMFECHKSLVYCKVSHPHQSRLPI